MLGIETESQEAYADFFYCPSAGGALDFYDGFRASGTLFITHYTPMKKIALTLMLVVASVGSASADAVIKEAMKKYHKPEDAIAKKVGKGEASDAELSELLKAYEDMKGAKPAKGDANSWGTKTGAVISALKKVQSKDPSGVSEYKKAINCKACHDVHKGK